MTHGRFPRARRSARRIALGAALASLATGVASCDLDSVLESLGGTLTSPDDLTGQNAFVHLQATSAAAPRADIDSVMEVLSLASGTGASTDDPSRFSPSQGAIDLMSATARVRRNVNTNAFERIDLVRAFGEPTMQPDQKAGPPQMQFQEYTIPTLNQVPVRDQQQRGTCAAFAGIGAIEYSILDSHSSLSTIDLSEQRFYWTSKPECQTSACNWEGSWYTTGMEASAASSTFDIPLESTCRYNGYPDYSNDTQIPQAAGCSDGAARVVQLEYTLDAQDIVDQLEQGLPVPFASGLSLNWEQNNGLITLAGSDYNGNTNHAAGHAYLIVGYRQLPNMPDEGGMCFVIKNSWGTGWGVQGYSCMTLAWTEAYGWGWEQPVVASVEVREDIAVIDQNDDEPPPYIDDEVYDDETVDYDELDNDTPIPEPDPGPDDLTWGDTYLVGPDQRYYLWETATDGATMYMRGTVRGSTTKTGTLALQLQGDRLIYQGDEVGRVGTSDVTLCTGEYDLLCSLRFEPAENRLYVEFLYGEFRAVSASELGEGNWQSLVPLSAIGFDMEFYRPDNVVQAALSPVFLRMTNNVTGVQTEPIRLVLDGLDIRAGGDVVGSVSPSSLGLCTGDYRGNCSLFSNDNRLFVIPGWTFQ